MSEASTAATGASSAAAPAGEVGRRGASVAADTTEDAMELRRAAMALAADLGATPEAVATHLDRMPSAYATGVAARAVVRHTLMTATVPGPREIRTRVTPGPAAAAGAGEGVPSGAAAGPGAQEPAVLDELDVVALDAPGWFARVAGVIALQGGSVVDAEAHTRDDGVLVDTFTVRRPQGTGGSWWARVEGDLVDAAAGRLAVRARVARRAQADGPAEPEGTSVLAGPDPDDPGLGRVEVRTRDRVGVLHGITSAMAELELDIVDARIHTEGGRAVDVFHVRVRDGSAPDADHLAELEFAVLWALSALGAPTPA